LHADERRRSIARLFSRSHSGSIARARTIDRRLAPITTAVELMELRGDPQSRRERAVIRRQAAHLKRLVEAPAE
jgi:hypothetical protein